MSIRDSRGPDQKVALRPLVFVDADGQVWAPRVYDLDTLESVRELVSDALHSRSIGLIDQALYKDIIAAAQTAIKALSTVQISSAAEGILHGLAAPQPSEHPERGLPGPGAGIEAKVC